MTLPDLAYLFILTVVVVGAHFLLVGLIFLIVGALDNRRWKREDAKKRDFRIDQYVARANRQHQEEKKFAAEQPSMYGWCDGRLTRSELIAWFYAQRQRDVDTDGCEGRGDR